jgi:hypothetical protein
MPKPENFASKTEVQARRKSLPLSFVQIVTGNAEECQRQAVVHRAHGVIRSNCFSGIRMST